MAAPPTDAIGIPPSVPPKAPQPALGIGPVFSEVQKNEQRQAAEELIKNLQAAIARKQKSFTIPAGDYRFDPKVSHGIDLSNVDDFKLDGRGATLWFDQTRGITLKNCRNVTLSGFTVDMDPLPWFQGRIDKIDRQAKFMEITLEPGYSIPPASTWQAIERLNFSTRPMVRNFMLIWTEESTSYKRSARIGCACLSSAWSTVFKTRHARAQCG
jgi:hypothetical protein